MRTNDFFSKNVLCNIISGNLDILHRCINGGIYQQWTAVVLLMQFIEYLLKYKIQNANKSFGRTHEIKKLYCDLTDDDRNNIERIFTKLINDRKIRDPGSFGSIEEFARRYNTAYNRCWRYEILNTNFNSDEKYFYLADTFTVLRALIESTDLEIDLSAIPNEDRLEEKILKDGVRWQCA